MLYSRLAFLVLICILVVQLITVDVKVFIHEYAAGALQSQPEKIARKILQPAPLSVLYTAQKDQFNSLIFTGDVLLARNVEYLTNVHGADYPYRSLNFFDLAQNPAVVGNFEASMPSKHVYAPPFTMKFSVSSHLLPALQKSGFTHLSLANNHAFDYGVSGYNNAKEQLEMHQIEVFGHPRVTSNDSVEFVKIDQKTVAIIAAYTLETLPAYSDLKNVFTYANSRSDYQIVYVHWGDEYVDSHNSRQKEAAQRFVEAGADMVIGHHPHVVQDVQLVDGVPVFYSLGNYIFDQYDSVATQEGLLLHLELTQDIPKVSLIPVTSAGSLSQPKFMKSKEHSRFLANLANRSGSELQKQIKNGVILLNEQVASSSKVAMMSE